MSTATALKARQARNAMVWRQEIPSVHLGAWRGPRRGEGQVYFVGLASELHGSVCTCCPRRTKIPLAMGRTS